MALSSNNIPLASDFVSIKARVKAEMDRRCRSGSLAEYGSATYDYTVTPNASSIMLTEHINKIVTPINAISPSGVNVKTVGDKIDSVEILDAQLSAHEAFPMRGSGTDCASGCSGLCSNGCWDSCTGCTGCSGCGGACSNSCSSGCDGGCQGCGSGCSAGCAPSCAGGCWIDGCTGGCTGCSGGCTSDCGGYCGGTNYN